MAILTTTEAEELARRLAREFFGGGTTTATFDLLDLKLMIQRIDQVMESTAEAIQTGYPTKLIEGVFYSHVKNGSGLSSVTVAQVGIALALWSMKRSGLI